MLEKSESSMPLVLLEPEGSKKIYHFKSCKIKSIHIVFYDFINNEIRKHYEIENPFLEEIKLDRFDCYQSYFSFEKNCIDRYQLCMRYDEINTRQIIEF